MKFLELALLSTLAACHISGINGKQGENHLILTQRDTWLEDLNREGSGEVGWRERRKRAPMISRHPLVQQLAATLSLEPPEEATHLQPKVQDCFEYRSTRPVAAYVMGSLEEPAQAKKYTVFDD